MRIKLGWLFLSFLIPSLTSCEKIKYGDFLIHRINLKSLGATTSTSTPDLYFKCEGPGVDDVCETLTYWNLNADLSFTTDFDGTRGSANYTFTLRERISSGDVDLATFTVDMGKHKGQDSFLIEESDVTVQIGVNWESKW